MLTQNALAPYFDFVISGEKLSKSKPHPEIYQIAVNALDGRHCIAVEDSPVGIASAKAANLYTIALKQRSCPLIRAQADIVIDDLNDIIQIIETYDID